MILDTFNIFILIETFKKSKNMSQNQSYFWQTTRHNVYLKRSAKYHLMMALMVVLAFSTVCLAELDRNFDDDSRVKQTEEETVILKF